MNLSKEEIEKAKETMKHWVEYEKQNKDKINKADELIEIQETLLQYIQELEQSNKYLDRENNRLEKIEFERDIANKMIDEMLIHISKISDCPLEVYDIDLECDKECGKISEQECWRKYFKEKVEEKLNAKN